MKEWISKSLADTEKIAGEVISQIKANENSATIIGLYGELGAGKTTFMKYFAKALGVEEEVNSPTFVLMKFFNPCLAGRQVFIIPSFHKLIHIDAYRLESGEDLKKLGWDELVSNPKNLICIEWPERVADILPEHIMLRFQHNEGGEENTRKISLA